MGAVLLGLVLGLGDRGLLKAELLYCAAGILLFYIGYLLERPARRS